MRLKKYIIGGFLGAFLLGGCSSDWLDVNKNPNAATEVEPRYLFGYAITSWSGNRTGGDSGLPLSIGAQLYSVDDEWGHDADRYDISPYSLGNTWKMYYATSGANLVDAIKLAKNKGSNNTVAQAKIVLAHLMYEATVIYGDIPYSEAWTEENSPKFDSQQEVLNQLIDLLTEATNLVDATSEKITTEDLFFSGDMNKWKQYANSLKLKIAFLMVDKDPSKAALIGSLVANPIQLATEPSSNVAFPYYNTSGHKNPKYRLLEKYNGGKNTWFYGSDVVIDGLMKPYNDPRLEKYFVIGEEGNGEFWGAPVGTLTAPNKKYAFVSEKTILSPERSDLVLSSQEINLLIAEAYARGLGVAQDNAQAQNYFEKGLRQSLKYYQVDDAKIKTFVEQPELNLTTSSNVLKVLREQQYVDLFERSLEAWVQQRRSGAKGQEIPNLQTPADAPVPNGEIMRRWEYPKDELNGNQKAPKTSPKLWDSQWFDL